MRREGVYHGFIVGTCSYDNAGDDNAYVVRYIFRNNEGEPGKPYTVVGLDDVELVKEWTGNFCVGEHWSASPDDRCERWQMVRANGKIFVRPL